MGSGICLLRGGIAVRGLARVCVLVFLGLWLVTPAGAAAMGPFAFGGPALIDTGAPYGEPSPFNTMSCPSATLCVGDTGSFGQIVSSTNPGSASAGDWSQFPTAQISGRAVDYSLGGVSCVIQGATPFCLAAGTDPTDNTVGGNAVFLRSTDPSGGPSAWQVQRSAPSPPLDATAPACAAGASGIVCVDGGGSLLWASSDASNPVAGGETGWGAAPFAAFACATANLCFAAQQRGTVLSSTTPGNLSSWPSATSSSTGLSSITGISCPTTTFCIVAGKVGSAYRIATSTNPGAATPTWSISTPSVPVTAISCAPDTNLAAPEVICFSSNGSTTSVSTDGGSTWVSESFASGATNAFACAGTTASLCIAGTSGGQVAHSLNAASGASATWSSPLPGAPGRNPVLLSAQSCPSSSVCVASDGAGRILTSTNPGGGAGAWGSSLVDPNGGGIFNLACASSHACVAFDDKGSVLGSTNPAGGASTWSGPSSSIDPNGILNLSCTSAGVCVATDLKGNVLTSSKPPFAAASWSTPSSIAGSSFISALTCPSSTACVGIDAAGHIYTSATPPFAPGSWSGSGSSIDPATIADIACPSSSLCLAIDSQGRVLTATAPFAAANWSAPSLSSIDANNTVTQLACPTSTLCIAADDNGNVLTSTSPPFGSGWSSVSVDPFSVITGLACTSTVICVIGDDGGNVLPGTLTIPVSSSPPVITGTATVGKTLVGAHGTWTNNPTGFLDRWLDCDTAGTSCAPIAGAAGLTYTLKGSDAGHTVRLEETASNLAGAGQPAHSAPSAVVTPGRARKTSCTVRAKSASVLLPPPTHGAKPLKRKPRGKPGTMSFAVRCDQSAKITLQGELTELTEPRHGKPHSKAFSLPIARGSVRSSVTLTLTIALPRAALAALRGRVRERVKVIVTATNASGRSTSIVTIPRLRPVLI